MLARAMTISVALALLGAPYAANAQPIPGAHLNRPQPCQRANGRPMPAPMPPHAIRR